MRRTVQQLSVDFVARGQAAVANATKGVVNALKGMGAASAQQATAAQKAVAVEQARIKILAESKKALEESRAAAQENVRQAEENARREVAAARKAAQEKTAAAKQEMEARKIALRDARNARTIAASTDPFNAVRDMLQKDIERYNVTLKRLTEAKNEALAAMEVAPPSQQTEIRENLEFYERRIADQEHRKKATSVQLNAGNRKSRAARAVENAAIEEAKRRVDEQKKLVDELRASEDKVAEAAKQTAKDTVATAKQEAGERVRIAEERDRDIVKSSKAAAARQIADMEKAAKAGQSRLPKLGLDTIARGGFDAVRNGAAKARGAVAGVFDQLSTKGLIPTVAPAMFKGAMAGGLAALKLAPGAMSLLAGISTKLLSTVWSLGTGIVKLGGSLVMWIGQKAVSAVTMLVGGLQTALGMMVRLGARAAFVGIGFGTGAALFAKKAIGDSAAAANQLRDQRIGSGTDITGLQGMKALAAQDGIDPEVITGNLKTVQEKMHEAFVNPSSEAAANFGKLGVRIQDEFTGRLRDAKDIFFDISRMARDQRWSYDDLETQLTPLLGGYEQWAKLLPMFQRIAGGNGFDAYNEALQRKADLGGLMDDRDLAIGKAFNVVSSEAADAWLGIKLAITRTIGPQVLQIARNLTEVMAARRFDVAAFALKAFEKTRSVAVDLLQILAGRPEAAKSGFLREAGMVALWVKYGFDRAWEGAKKLWAALDKPINQAWIGTLKTGLFAAGRLLRETILTLGGDGKYITEFPWLLKIRSGVASTVRFVREAFNTLSGNVGLSDEFPWLKAVKNGVDTAIATVRRFGTELVQAVTGQGMAAGAAFPWLFTARDAAVAIFGQIKVAALDAFNVMTGGQAATGIGQWVQTAMQWLETGKAAFWGFVDNAQKLWGDLENLLSGGPGATGKAFQFPGLDAAYQKLVAIQAGIEAVWDRAKGIYGFVNGIVERLSFGYLNLPVVGLLTMLGVTRLVAGALRLAIKGMGGLGGAIAKVAGAIGGGGAAGAAGAAVAGAGLAAGMSTLATNTGTAGAAAEKATGKWSRLSGAIGKVGALFAKYPFLGSILGIGGVIAGGLISDAATPNSSSGAAMSVGGGMLSGAAGGAMAGALFGPKGALAGAVLGGAYGALTGYWDYLSKSREQKITEYKAANPGATDAQANAGVDTMDAAATEIVSAASESKEAAGDLKVSAAELAAAAGMSTAAAEALMGGRFAAEAGGDGAYAAAKAALAANPAAYGSGYEGIRIPDVSAAAASVRVPEVSVPSGPVIPGAGASLAFFRPDVAAWSAAEKRPVSQGGGNTLIVNLPTGGTIEASQTDRQLADARRQTDHFQGRRF